MFSRRTEHDPAPNDLTCAVRARRAGGLPIWDLTDANPTGVGLPLLDETLLAQPGARRYEPDALGHRLAKESVVREYARAGLEVEPERVVITASTSEAYSYLFKILADPGDTILIPAPSYPLFDFLARGESVGITAYPLLFDGQGHHYEADLALHALALATPRPRAVIAVSPNHPTGSQVSTDFVAAMHAQKLPVIVDEVFGRFDLDELAPLGFGPATHQTGLTFRLCGLSKQLGLPQVKLSWMIVEGPEPEARAALDRLELVADTFLSVGSPVQHALPALFEQGAAFRAQVVARTRENLESLRGALAGTSMSVLRAPAGWTAVIRVSASHGDEVLAGELLESQGVLVHPGSFFGFGFSALVVSLLPEPAIFATAAARIAAFARSDPKSTAP